MSLARGEVPSRAEREFARFLLSQESADPGSIEALCTENADLAEELRRLHANWLHLRHGLELGVRCASTHSPSSMRRHVAMRIAYLSRPRTQGARYRVEGEIAAGGMGRVVRVWDEDLERPLAMKVARDSGDGGDEDTAVRGRARLLEEARITGRLAHPGIVPVHELGLDAQGRVFFTMKLVEGRHLGEVFEDVRRGEPGWTRARAVDLLLRVCEAMAFAHDRQVVHRDLKPSNVMVGRFGEVHVMDWGLARELGRAESGVLSGDPAPAEGTPSLTLDGEVLGTPAYMAPEQARGEEANSRTDVYAVGAMLYHLLAGRVPYVGAEEQPRASEVLARVLMGPPPPLAGLAPRAPSELVAICKKAMARASADRYGSMDELANDLRAFLEQRVVRAYETGPLVELRKWVRRNPGFATAAAVMVVAGLLAVIAYAFFRSERERERAFERDPAVLAYLREQWIRLAPPGPDALPALDQWLEEAQGLADRAKEHRQRLGAAGASPIELETRRRFLEGLEGFLDQRAGTLQHVPRWRTELADLRLRTIEKPAMRAAWEEACVSIADTEDCPAYEGLHLPPQVGLVPLGRDPVSGLWEFAHVLSGEPSARDPSSGALILDAASAIVLVLLPGGRYSMGAQDGDPALPNYEPAVEEDEGPVHEVVLEPFFLAKHELTQGQCLRICGENPSEHGPGRTWAGAEITALHPVTSLARGRAEEILRFAGLCLPSEAQWEYAARAGTSTPWYTGARAESLQDHANLPDRYFGEHGGTPHVAQTPWDDGYLGHAPVGIFLPNPFGLHDVIGNVWELCGEEVGGDYTGVIRDPRSGRSSGPPRPARSIARGGCSATPAELGRSANRSNASEYWLSSYIGVRAARPVMR